MLAEGTPVPLDPLGVSQGVGARSDVHREWRPENVDVFTRNVELGLTVADVRDYEDFIASQYLVVGAFYL